MSLDHTRGMLQHLIIRVLLKRYMWKNRTSSGAALPARQRINLMNARMLLNIYEHRGTANILSGFLVPAELLHAYGTSQMFTENLAATIAAAGYAKRTLEHAERLGFSRDGCSFHRATLGAGLLGILPRFDLIIATSHLCDGQNKALEELAIRTGTAYMLLDVPNDGSPASVDYLAAQLEELEDRIAELTGRRARLQDWERVFGYSNQTRDMMLRLSELRRARPCPLYGKSAFNLAFQSALMVGTEFLTDCYKDLLREVEGLKAEDLTGEKFRIGWLLAYPYFSDNFIPFLESTLGVRAVTEEFSEVFWDPLDPGQPMRSLARKMLQNPNLGPVSNRVQVVEKMVRDCGLHGVLHYSHMGCRQGCGGVRPIADALKKLNIPFLDLDGDCVDSRNYSKGQTMTRLQGFVELMDARRVVNPRIRNNDHFYLGIDIGSLSAKAVVINGSGEMVFDSVILTGASSKKAVEKLRHAIFHDQAFDGKILQCVATGYGRGVVGFADRQVTEITCHARGMAHVAKGVHTIIDIGGQGTKVIAIEDDGQVRAFAMNDKCAAGTGRFLETMARTLEIDIEDLAAHALEAKKSIAISSMCTVFAESEVVSLIADGTPVTEIARGVCAALAARTAALLERVGRQDKIAMSGGVAKNAGVVKAIERALDTRLEMSSNPQIIGALGAALIARDGDR